MFENLAKWYLSRLMRKKKLNNIEMVIRSNGNTWRARNFEREKSIERTLSKIK